MLSACKEMDSEYKEFVVPDGHVYPQRADSLKVYSGINRLQLRWLKPKSPTVKYAMVYWNNYTDSMKVDWPSSADTVVADIPKLTENSYTVYIKNFDLQGNVSMPNEITGTPYGENYLVSALDRKIVTAERSETRVGQINWGVKTPDLVYNEVRYVTSDGSKKTLRANYDQNVLNLPDIKIGEFFEYRSLFLPQNGIDTVARNWKVSDKPFLYKLPRSKWTATSRGGNHNWGGSGGSPNYLFDGDTQTGWHSKPGTGLPQVLVVDMKESSVIDNIVITLTDRQDWRYLNKMEVYLSDTMLSAEEPTAAWGKPIATTTYDGSNPFKVQFEKAKTGRYLALVFPDSKVETYISFMELEAYGY